MRIVIPSIFYLMAIISLYFMATSNDQLSKMSYQISLYGSLILGSLALSRSKKDK